MYVMSSTIESINPSFGTIRGGTLLTMEGSDYDETRMMYCWFGESLLEPAIFVSSRKVQCATPRSESAKVVSIRVIDEGYANATSVIHTLIGVSFEYINDAVVSSIYPSSGPISGGTPVLFVGDNFIDSDNLTCWLSQDISSAFL